MEEITVKELEGKLTTLDVARRSVERIEGDLKDAESLYRFAIKLLENAMDDDPAIVEIREDLDIVRQIEEDATAMVSKAAIAAWQTGLTGGKKEWKHGNWEIRLRTTLTPVVTHIENFIAHLAELKATGIVKRITLNRKATTDLNSTVKLTGLEIEEKTTCSAKCV